MSLKHVFAVVTLLSTSAFAEEDLKPAQEEAKAKLEAEIEDALKAANDKCGTKLEVKTDFQNFKTDEWSGTSFSSYCEAVLQEIGSMCENRPAYKKVIAKKVTGVACLFGGVKPVEKKDGSNDATLRNMSIDKGVFTYHMSPKGHANLNDNTKATLEKAFN